MPGQGGESHRANPAVVIRPPRGHDHEGVGRGVSRRGAVKWHLLATDNCHRLFWSADGADATDSSHSHLRHLRTPLFRPRGTRIGAICEICGPLFRLRSLRARGRERGRGRFFWPADGADATDSSHSHLRHLRTPLFRPRGTRIGAICEICGPLFSFEVPQSKRKT